MEVTNDDFEDFEFSKKGFACKEMLTAMATETEMTMPLTIFE